ncbi:MAG: hypothetical protein AAGD32_05325 [Planctomycetota bacterium]
MTQALATPRGTYQKGDTYDLPNEIAERFVEKKIAEPFTATPPKPTGRASKGAKASVKGDKQQLDTPKSEKV